jgi:uroporphyrinogen decarboxylase
MRKPDYEHNTLRILRGQKAERATLFEIFLNTEFYERLAGRKAKDASRLEQLKLVVDAMASAGYDYATTHASDYSFTHTKHTQLWTISLNDRPPVTDWKSFEAYDWGDPRLCDTSALEKIGGYLPEGMKLMVMGPGGVLENMIALMGYDNLCMTLYDDLQLVRAVADKVGETLVSYYQDIVGYDSVGFLCSNDDWGFNTQTFLSPEDMRTYIFPWHQRIVEVAHKASKPCILHSCGYFEQVIEDVIVLMRYDGRHSYEDKICPVEEAYELLAGRIAVMGGIDMDFMTRKTPREIYDRATAMLQRSKERGGYFLGTGNSVPETIPFDNYLAMTQAAFDFGKT